MKKLSTGKQLPPQESETSDTDERPELLSVDGFGEPTAGGWKVDVDILKPDTVQKTREAFFDTIAEHYPEVLLWLSQKVLPTYSKACIVTHYHSDGSPCITFQHWHLLFFYYLERSIKNNGIEGSYLLKLQGRLDEQRLRPEDRASIGLAASTLPELRLIREMLIRWSDEFSLKSIETNLTQDWCIYIALRTLWSWSALSANQKKWGYARNPPGVEFQMNNPERDLRFEFFRWEPSRDTWMIYKERIEKAFAKRLEAYKKRKLIEAQLAGIPIVKETHAEAHYKWLADFQVGRKSISEIARNANIRNGGVDRKTVSQAIRNLAAIIGLSLRPNGTKS